MSEKFLRECLDRHKCDKGFKHGYEHVYAHLFEQVRARFGRVDLLEIGVFEGASSRAFSDYMSALGIDHHIYAMDTYQRLPMSTVAESCKNYTTISFIQDDSQKPTRTEKSWQLAEINMIIDDAEHTPDANRITLEKFWDCLLPGGVYVIEDVWPLDVMTSEEMTHHWLRTHAESYTLQKYYRFLEAVQERDPLMEEIDMRLPHPDSYIIKMEKESDSVHNLSSGEQDLMSSQGDPDTVH